ncbi:hypothetical protein S7711_05911 [Stachybotrys chartarum IBT 7711]|uniref:Acyltransferase 3 domain-containing protein n=1 Tax=Stachybotrys chartarum (strain CBS 109288 / IBT 7711) TaxID=1280523 RepID=A0A084B190_STACB|nr:hypothetical protein S7711_05911 [Stachybotrys chartarum IBT 7711]
MNRTTWLDGLRGIAAAIVTTDHYFMGGVLDAAFRSFWADPPEENRKLIQLPPLRLLFAAHAMVPLFLVISGYAISINLIRHRERDSSDFVRRLASAVTRRVFRIYLPVFCIAAISQLLLFFNLYSWEFGDEVVWGRKPWVAPWYHVEFVFRYMLDNMNILYFQNNGGLNGQLWTMALEFRGSCIVYLIILGLAFWRPRARRLALGALITYWFYFGLWDVVGFLAGLYLAELHILSESGSTRGESMLPSHLRNLFGAKGRSVNLTAVTTYTCLIFGTWLLCLGDDGHLTPGYQFLSMFETDRWEDDWGIIGKMWKTVGSALVVYAISKSELLQRPLNSKPVQYLGKISFSLYLVHQVVYHVFRNPVRNVLWYIATREPYSGEEAGNRTFPFAFAWIVGYFIVSAINLYTADVYTRYVDEKCMEIAKMFDKWVSQ